jgi:sulfatase modifying factor 1
MRAPFFLGSAVFLVSAVACNGQTSAEHVEAATVVVPPSCTTTGPGLTDCGANAENCCTSLEVTPGGTFYRSGGNGNPATVSPFRLDKYDVTVGRFRKFVAAWKGGWTPAAGSGKHSHLNGGKGLATGGTDAGPGFEPGWLSLDDANLAPTDANLGCTGPLVGAGFSTWTSSAGNNEGRP